MPWHQIGLWFANETLAPGHSGDILLEGQTFTSPSAFSLYVKRKANPMKRPHDRWSSVVYEGHLLTVYRPEYAKRDGAEEQEK